MALKPITDVILQAAGVYYRLPWDGSTALHLSKRGGVLTIQHAGVSYTAVPADPAALPDPAPTSAEEIVEENDDLPLLT